MHRLANLERRCLTAMAPKAPTHRQRLRLHNLIHRFDVTVTRLARDTAPNVRTVIESNVIGQLVDTNPLDRTLLFKRLAHLLNERAFSLHHGVTVHANMQSRHSGVNRSFNAAMAVLTRNLVLARMNAMTKR